MEDRLHCDPHVVELLTPGCSLGSVFMVFHHLVMTEVFGLTFGHPTLSGSLAWICCVVGLGVGFNDSTFVFWYFYVI